jgi:hypothetical protein
MMSIGMMCFIIALVLPRFLQLTANLGPDLNDAVRGALFGVSIGMNFLSVSLAARQRRCAKT